jgi:uncharacterized ferritin-like protein (DUF455 family)
MKSLGLEFGDIPVNDFFWKNALKLSSVEEYFALMSLTFEAANLDFGIFYRDTFRSLGDEKSADIMQIVHDDEVAHVALGVTHLKKKANDKSLWEYYKDLLPKDLAPSRSKGVVFDEEGRKQAGIPADFIETIRNYRDQHPITNRRLCQSKPPIK